MLMNLGAKSMVEAADGLAALEVTCTRDPEVMFLDWDIPVLRGMEAMRIARSPGAFPRPNLPIIMLTNHGQRSTVIEAFRGRAHEFLLKPTSPKALGDRLMSIVIKPRPMVKLGKYIMCRNRAACRCWGSCRRQAEGARAYCALQKNGAPEGIRTSDLCLRRATLYPAELRARARALT